MVRTREVNRQAGVNLPGCHGHELRLSSKHICGKPSQHNRFEGAKQIKHVTGKPSKFEGAKQIKQITGKPSKFEGAKHVEVNRPVLTSQARGKPLSSDGAR